MAEVAEDHTVPIMVQLTSDFTVPSVMAGTTSRLVTEGSTPGLRVEGTGHPSPMSATPVGTPTRRVAALVRPVATTPLRIRGPGRLGAPIHLRIRGPGRPPITTHLRTRGPGRPVATTLLRIRGPVPPAATILPRIRTTGITTV